MGNLVDRAPGIRGTGHSVFCLLYVAIVIVLISSIGDSRPRYGQLYSTNIFEQAFDQAIVGFCIVSFLVVLIQHLFFMLLTAILDALATIAFNDIDRERAWERYRKEHLQKL